MTDNQLKNKLQEIANKQENSIEKTVALKLLTNNNYRVIFLLKTMKIEHAVHFITPTMRTSDYHSFFDMHYSEIEELRFSIENHDNFDFTIKDKLDLKNQLSIFAITNIIRKFNRELNS